MGLTPVIGFLDDEGLDVLAPTFDEIVDLLQNRVETTVVEEPFRVSVAIEGEAGRLSISLDEDMNVVGLDRQGPN
jgi:hypothetical protein